MLKARFRYLKNGIVAGKQEEVDNVFFTCIMLHNMILMHDGLDTLWDGQTEEYWEQLNPQNDNSDEGYDEDDGSATPISAEEQAVIQRVREGPVVFTAEELEELRNYVIAEVDNEYDQRKRDLITSFLVAYDKGEVFWPRGFSKKQEEEQLKAGKCYRKIKV